MAKLIAFSSNSVVRSIPVVVTTAEMFHAQFDHNRISLREGRIEEKDLELEPLSFCAVNYHADDKLALKTESNSMSRTNIQNDLLYWQTRTVFVVQSECMNSFLRWAAQHLTEHR